MLKIQEVVNFVNSKLNELGTESDYSFDIHAEIGENQNNGKINGILYTSQASTTPIPDYTENNYVFVCELLVPSARANKNFVEIQKIVESFIANYDGKEVNFTDGDGLLNVSPSKPENFNVGHNAGENVPLFFTISVLYTEEAVTSADAHWFLNGYEIPYMNEDVLVDKEGNINKVYGKYNTQVFLTSQTKYYRFVFPFKHGNLCLGLQSDLMEGKFDKQYTLTYYDNESYLQNNPFTTRVSIFKSGNFKGQRGKAKTFDITFAEVDEAKTTDNVRYYLALIDNKFDNQTENTRWFEDTTTIVNGQSVITTAQQNQQAYYESKINQTSPILTGTKYEQIKAPNLNSIDITSQIYPNTSKYDLFDLANKNYAIIKVEKGLPTDPTYQKKYFYYFVTNCQIGADNQVMYDLKLDTIQTYMFDPNIEFSDCYIERSNLNRWVNVTGDNTKVAFDGGVNSKLFEREQTQNVAKRLTKRTKLNTFSVFQDDAVNKWFEDNVEAWMYAYLDSSHTFNAYTWDSNNTKISLTFDGYGRTLKVNAKNNAIFDTKLLCMCVPILKKPQTNTQQNQIWIVKGTTSADPLSNLFCYFTYSTTFDSFLNGNKGASGEENANRQDAYVLAKKISNEPPISSFITTGYNGYSIDAYNNLILFYTDPLSDFIIQGSAGDSNGMVLVKEQDENYETSIYELSNKLSFKKSDIIGATKNPQFNPKLLNSDYKTLKICGQGEDGFDYDAQKLNMQTFSLIVSEPLAPDITKEYIRVKNQSGIYIADTQNNFTGIVNSNDTSLILITDQFQNMLAQQKNYFQQNALNRQEQAISGAIGSVSGILGGAITKNPFGIVSGIISGAQTIMHNINAKKQEAYTVDNMKNAPASIQNAKGNVFLNAMSTGFGVFVEEYDILPNEKNIENDFMVQYGFTTNQIGQIKDYLGDSVAGHKNSRRYFNYIQAQINSISGIPMSNVARADMRQRFADGIRFWKQDNIDYTYENYEVWLAE